MSLSIRLSPVLREPYISWKLQAEVYATLLLQKPALIDRRYFFIFSRVVERLIQSRH